MADRLVRPLFGGKIDIVGDVHGEIEALLQLLHRLGFDEAGRHPQGRRLVFVGDLVDRGPDSPAVVELVRGLVERGRAQCILGNHELNILLNRPKPENSWLLEDAPPLQHEGQPVHQESAGGPAREAYRAFFAALPLVLEGEEVRVVHACWDAAHVERVRGESDAVRLCVQHRARIADDLRRRGAGEQEGKLAQQNLNPVKLLTSGREGPANPPVRLGGRLRHERRLPWWEDYAEREQCVFGHYWRRDLPGEEECAYLFAGRGREQTLGPGAALCIDYSVGRRFRERLGPDFAGWYHTQLGALRLPERVLVFDNEEGQWPVRR
jgi:hypothetical protein